jgi:hypothetical protein
MNDMANTTPKTKITGIGILNGRFSILHYKGDAGIDIRASLEKDMPIDFKKGIEIAPNLKLRFTKKEDLDLFTTFNPPLAQAIIPYSLGHYVLEGSLETKSKPEKSRTEQKIKHDIDSAALALRLLKPGYIDANAILWIAETDAKKQTQLSAELHPSIDQFSEYCLATHEIPKLCKLTAKTLNIDLEKRKSLRIAVDRFNRSYYEEENEDRLIDYIIAFEALFSSHERRSQHAIIAVACAMLLGKSEKQRREIINLLDLAYKTRNCIVHGSDLREMLEEKKLNLEELTSKVEQILRASLRKLI